VPSFATSFEADTANVRQVAASFDAALARVPRPSGALIFVSGRLGAELPALAQALLAVPHRPPILLAAGAGVLTERRAIEGRPAATGLIWCGGSTELVSVYGDNPEELGEALTRCLSDRAARRQPPVISFARADAFGAEGLDALRDLRQQPCIVGGGAVGHPGVLTIQPDGFISDASMGLAIPRGIGNPRVETASACRLLGPMLPITGCRGPLVTELDGRPVLDVLGSLAESVEGEMALLAAIEELPRQGFDRVMFTSERPSEIGHDIPSEDDEVPPDFITRPVRGVDPEKGEIHLGDPLPLGTKMTFAVLDPEAARRNVEEAVRRMIRKLGGALPRFGIYTDCAARGTALYGMPNVDMSVIQDAFPGVPIVGMQSSYELAPHDEGTRLHLYTGVLTLFTAAS
jgi:small ligand-binding sensory domain FIST